MLCVRSSLALAFVAVVASKALAGDWPQLRGRGATANDETKFPIRWSDDNILWKTRLPGPGVSSPAVSGDAIFLTFSNADGAERTLARYGVKSGTEVWRRSLSFSTHRKHKKNTYATATPALDGKHVAALFADREKFLVAVYSMAGELLWRQDVGGFNGEHGAGGSPIIEDGKLFFAKEQDGASSLYAFDVKTGEKVWQTDYTVDKATYSTPIIYRGADGRTCVVCSHSYLGLAGYDLATGKQLWKCDGFDRRTVGMPVQAGSMVLATAGEGSNGKTMLAVDLSTFPSSGNELQPTFALTKGIPYCPTPIAVGDRCYFVTDVGVGGCIDSKTGKEIWSERLGGPHAASPVFANGAIFFLSEQGDVTAIKPSDEFKRLAKFHLNDYFLATPAIVDGRMYLRGEAHLWCIGTK